MRLLAGVGSRAELLHIGVADEVVLVLVREVLEGEALGLGKKEGRPDTGEHEEGEELEDVVDPGVGAANVLEAREADLGDDGAELA